MYNLNYLQHFFKAKYYNIKNKHYYTYMWLSNILQKRPMDVNIQLIIVNLSTWNFY